MGTALFTALSYLIGKHLGISSDNIGTASTTFFWFFGAAITAFSVSVIIPSQKHELKNLRKYGTILILTSLFTSVGGVLWVKALWIIGPALTSFLMKAQTLFSLLLGVVFLRETIGRGEAVGIGLTVAGGIVVTYHKDQYLLLGVAAVLVSALCYSMVSFWVRTLAVRRGLNMLTVSTMRTMGVSVILLVYLMASGTLQIPGTRELLLMAAGGTCGAYIAKSLQFYSIRLLGLSRSTAVMPLESLFVVLLSLVFFDTIPSTAKLLGGACIIIGVVFLVMFRDEKTEALIIGKIMGK